MIDAKENPAFGKIHQQRDEIVPSLLELNVLALMEVVNTNVNFRAARHPARQLLAEEESGPASQLFGTVDRIVIREREEIHASPLQQGVHLFRIAIAFAAEVARERSRARAREITVDVHVAFHNYKCTSNVLLTCDNRAKLLKSQIFNSYDTAI